MEADLRARLLAASGVAALVGTRVTWVDRPKTATLPALTLGLVSPGRDYTHSGPDGLSDPRVQFDCWAETRIAAAQLADAVIAALEPAATVGTTKFGPAFVEDKRDMETEELAGGVKVHRRSVDMIVWHQPA